MSKLILEFNLPDEREESEMALDGARYYGMLYDVWYLARNAQKYADSDVVAVGDIFDAIEGFDIS
jgi:hypothetical protein